MACCGKKQDVRSATKKINKPPIISSLSESDPNMGCYLYVWESNVWLEWAWSPPEETFFLFAHPTLHVPPGKYHSRMLGDATNEQLFLEAAFEYLREVTPYLPHIYMKADVKESAPFPFIILFHETGNDVIGNRVVKLKFGKVPVYTEGSDCIAIALESSGLEPKQQSLKDFIVTVKAAGGKQLQLDPLGKSPPLLIE